MRHRGASLVSGPLPAGRGYGHRRRRATLPGMSVDLRFQTTIGVEVKGETWSCVEIPGSVEFLGTGSYRGLERFS